MIYYGMNKLPSHKPTKTHYSHLHHRVQNHDISNIMT